MTAYPVRSLPVRLLALVAALLLGGAFVIASAQPAAAHDELISSDPADGTTVDVLPAQITLSYSAALLGDEGGTAVEVTDAAGNALADGAPVTDQNIVTQQLVGDATGAVTVLWRVVSSDGHPISGEFTFTVAGTAAPTASPTATPEASESAAGPSAEPSASPTAATTSEDAAPASPLPWVIGGLVFLAVVVVVIVLLAARARQQRQTAADRTAGRDDLSGR